MKLRSQLIFFSILVAFRLLVTTLDTIFLFEKTSDVQMVFYGMGIFEIPIMFFLYYLVKVHFKQKLPILPFILTGLAVLFLILAKYLGVSSKPSGDSTVSNIFSRNFFILSLPSLVSLISQIIIGVYLIKSSVSRPFGKVVKFAGVTMIVEPLLGPVLPAILPMSSLRYIGLNYLLTFGSILVLFLSVLFKKESDFSIILDDDHGKL
jgi:hypothetical protein